MSADEGIDRKRRATRPVLPPGPLADLKDALHGMYLSAGTPSMTRIRARIQELADGAEVSDPTATPSVDTVHQVLTSPTLPANVHHVIAVTAALVYPHHIDGDVPVVRGHPRIEEIRRLWERAAVRVPPGRRIRDIPPADLEVRRTLPAEAGDSPMPDYILRGHDHRLCDLAAAALATDGARSGIAVLVNDSTSGKTRALFEVLRFPIQLETADGNRLRPLSLAEAGWRVWPPRSPYPADRFLAELKEVGPKTVVWLNEAQRYLIDPDERTARDIAAELRALLADPARTPVLVLGTLWPQYHSQISRRPSAGEDHYAEARALIEGHIVPVAGSFVGEDLSAARASTDSRIRDAIAAADDAAGGPGKAARVPLTQYMAGVPGLLDLATTASTTVAAVLHAAMDARRCGHGEWLPLALLHHAAAAYLDDHEQRQHMVDRNWFTHALITLTSPLEGAGARALHRPPILPGRLADDVVKLEDYLDQYGRTDRFAEIPPAGFWTAAAAHAQHGDQEHLGYAAWARGLYRDAAQLFKNASRHGNMGALAGLARAMNARLPTDLRPFQWIVEHTSFERAQAVWWLLSRLHAFGLHDQAIELARRAATQVVVEDAEAIAYLLAAMRKVSAVVQAQELARRAALHVRVDNTNAVILLLEEMNRLELRVHTAALVRRAAPCVSLCDGPTLRRVLAVMDNVEAYVEVAELARRAASHFPLDDAPELATLLATMHEIGAYEQAVDLAGRAVRSSPHNLFLLGCLLVALSEVEDYDAIAALARHAARHSSLVNVHDVDELLMKLHVRKAGWPLGVRPRRTAKPPLVFLSTHTMRLIDRALREARNREHVEDMTNPANAGQIFNDGDVTLFSMYYLPTADTAPRLADPNLVPRATLGTPNAWGLKLKWLTSAMQSFGVHTRLTALLKPTAADDSVHNEQAVAWFTIALHDLGDDTKLSDLLEHLINSVDLDDVDAVASLLRVVRDFATHGQVASLARGIATTRFHSDDTEAAADLLTRATKLRAGHPASELARHAATLVPLNYSPRMRRLLLTIKMRDARASEPLSNTLFEVSIGGAEVVVGLLHVLHAAGADDEMAVLIRRATKKITTAEDAAELLLALNELGGRDDVVEFAQQAAVHASLHWVTTYFSLYEEQPVTELLRALHAVKVDDQITVLARRARETITKCDEVVELLHTLHEIEAFDEVRALAKWAATDISLDDLDAAAQLVRTAHDMGAGEEVAGLTERLPAAGMFATYVYGADRRVQFRFGRNHDGTPSIPWGWDDLL